MDKGYLKSLLKEGNNSDILQLLPITINNDYRKEWNVHETDFVCLMNNVGLVSDSFFRIGGFGVSLKDDYFMLLKHVEAQYSKEILEMSNSKKAKHLDGRWTIFDKNGVEKIEFDRFASVYLIKNSVIYTLNGNYYNIETGELYCSANESMESTEFLFLENNNDYKDKSRRGIFKINKKDGSYEILK